MGDQSIIPKEDFEKQMKRQSDLFRQISTLDDHSLSVQELLDRSAGVISTGWIRKDPVSASVEFSNQVYKSADFKKTEWDLSVKKPVRTEHQLTIKIYSAKKHSFTGSEQELAEIIATILAKKINLILSEQELQEEKELLDKAYKLANIGTWEYDMLNDKLYWSVVTKDVHGFGEDYEPDVESTVNLFKEGYSRETFAKAASDAIEKEKPFDVELKIISGKGDERWIRATGEPEYKDGVCVRFYGISQNVTARRKAEEEVELNDRRFKVLVQHGMDMIAILDEEANYRYVSPTSISVLGIPADFFIGKNAFDFIFEEDKERIFQQFSALNTQETVQLKPFRFLDSDDNWRWIESTVTNLTDDPAVQGFVANSRDVTQRQIKQEQIIESLKEKETLLAEIHHRIKNNLSVLTGLLQLQASKENNEEVLERLFDSTARIQTMASIHEQLYQTNNFSSIEFADRIQLLAINIQKTFQIKSDIKLSFQCESAELPVGQALTCSLIANEVLTNIFKHAFTGKEKGRIKIEFKRKGNNQVKLTISDDGIGLPDDFAPQKSNSLGLTLIKMLAKQLRGEYSFTSDERGTVFSLSFTIDRL